MMMRDRETICGFTLIEVLLAVSVLSLIVFTIMTMIPNSIQANAKTEAINLVAREGQYLTSQIHEIVTSAEEITQPSVSTTDTVLEVVMGDTNRDPSLVEQSGGQLLLTEGVSAAVSMHSSDIIVSGFQVTHNELADGQSLITYVFTLSVNNIGGLPEYSYTQDFGGSIHVLDYELP